MPTQSGQSLLEVVTAAAIGILVVTALTFATIFSLRNATFAKNSAQATKLAQEGIELVRAGRDRDGQISITGTSVDHWNSSSPIWSYKISDSSGCDQPDITPPGYCYFQINPSTLTLTNVSTFGETRFPLDWAEKFPNTANPILYRLVTLSDDLNHDKNFTNDDYQHQKEVTVIVRWFDSSGPHESRLTTILRKL